ncbi:MAG: 4-hydroxythreonine-4-phosphate dehydrogenase PdxA [Planctomycetaceae bacterium]|nr:4-hydroxythreonine-4-phosphate dehydrogenase PdxA [Planctomycetaceae bacterium]
MPPKLAITVGDVAGVGPEVIVRALADEPTRSRVTPVVFGPIDALERAARLVGSPLRFRRVSDASVAPADAVPCIDATGIDAASIAPGTVDPRAGEIAYRSLRAAIDAALSGEVDGIVTAPLNKLALHQAGHDVPGHTEILAEACGVRDVAMMLYLPAGPTVKSPYGLGVAHVTLHTSIASVPGLLTEGAIASTTRLVDGFMRQMGCIAPRIGVCALNPHAGEGGLFGDEEQRIIAPAVLTLQQAQVDARGPYPADTLMSRAIAGEFDGVAAMYHDQGHIAIKLIAFHSAVNVTLGLPIIRTSPTQGTAFDIAWRGIANPSGMISAINVAVQLVAHRNRT